MFKQMMHLWYINMIYKSIESITMANKKIHARLCGFSFCD